MISDKLPGSQSVQGVLEDLTARGLNDLRSIMERLFNELMVLHREHHLQAGRYERSDTRDGHANGFKDKRVQTRMGPMDLSIPQVRGSSRPFYPSCVDRGLRSEDALKLAIAEMVVNGVSTRRVKRITEELCDFEVSSTQVSRLSALMDEELEKFRSRPLGSFRYVYLDATYIKVRHDGHVIDLAALMAIGVNADGYREVLGVSVSLSEAEVHWRSFLENLQGRGLCGVELMISDAHTGLKAALKAVFPSIPWQRCIFHLAQNAQSYVPNVNLRAEIAQAVRDIYSALSVEEAEQRVRAAVQKYALTASRFSVWLEEQFQEGLTFFRFPKSQWKKLRTVNGLERLNQEVKRRVRVARLFPNVASALRLITAVVVEVHEDWIASKRYMDFGG